MANVYKDEKGHFTNKENDGGPCRHKRINGGKYEYSEDGGKSWSPFKGRKEYDEYDGEESDFDLNEEDDFGFDEDVHMDYEEIFTDNDTAQIERYARHYGVNVEELKDTIHQNALDRIRQGDSVTNAKNDAMEEELDKLEPGSAPLNDEPNPMDEFSGDDQEGPSYAQMEAGFYGDPTEKMDRNEYIEYLENKKGWEHEDAVKHASLFYEEEKPVNKNQAKRKYEVTLDGDLLGEVEANSPEEAERLAQQRWPNHTDDDLLRVDEKETGVPHEPVEMPKYHKEGNHIVIDEGEHKGESYDNEQDYRESIRHPSESEQEDTEMRDSIEGLMEQHKNKNPEAQENWREFYQFSAKHPNFKKLMTVEKEEKDIEDKINNRVATDEDFSRYRELLEQSSELGHAIEKDYQKKIGMYSFASVFGMIRQLLGDKK